MEGTRHTARQDNPVQVIEVHLHGREIGFHRDMMRAHHLTARNAHRGHLQLGPPEDVQRGQGFDFLKAGGQKKINH